MAQILRQDFANAEKMFQKGRERLHPLSGAGDVAEDIAQTAQLIE